MILIISESVLFLSYYKINYLVYRMSRESVEKCPSQLPRARDNVSKLLSVSLELRWLVDLFLVTTSISLHASVIKAHQLSHIVQFCSTVFQDLLHAKKHYYTLYNTPEKRKQMKKAQDIFDIV